MRRSLITFGLLLSTFIFFQLSCTSKLKIAQNYPQSSTLDDTQKIELLETLSWEFPDINASNVEKELQPFVLVKGESHPLTQFVAFDDEMHRNFRMHDLDFVPYWTVRSKPHIHVFFMEGYGWKAPVWSYILFDSKAKTILDIAFFHKGETRTYGGDISLDWYQDQYTGAKLASDGKLNFMENPAREVYTFGGTKIDGTSGSTVTNDGIQNMFNNMLKNYKSLIISSEKK